MAHLCHQWNFFFFYNKHLQTHIDSVNQECNSTSMCTTKDGCFAIVLNNVLCLDIKNFGNFLKYFYNSKFDIYILQTTWKCHNKVYKKKITYFFWKKTISLFLKPQHQLKQHKSTCYHNPLNFMIFFHISYSYYLKNIFTPYLVYKYF